MMHDPLSDAMVNIQNYSNNGKSECTVLIASNMLKNVLEVFKNKGYIADFKEEENRKGGAFNVALIRKISKCGVIKPRFPVQLSDIEKYERRYLPAKGVGHIILSTSQGILTHEEAYEKKIGGVLLAYIY
ncbi:MAG: 30S ribosomal protein S8 [Euryarchaeota archaeon]|jgi:small subunit ribosomal protein S8|nr:30S ribosomal protein S8 [Euryarchaeota archaeon]|tara:strand:+ start:30256 stop:30645 length:390 start_codon:yes stop_codon:yes gene_type:complete